MQLSDMIKHLIQDLEGEEFTNIPQDNGHGTRNGITQSEYDSKRDSLGLARQSVANISMDETIEIYTDEYYKPAKCDMLPNIDPYSLAFVHFQWAVNHGIGGANKTLQYALNVPVDGILGPISFAALKQEAVPAIIDKYLNRQLEIYDLIVENNPSQDLFLNGWKNRVIKTGNIIAGLPVNKGLL